MNIFDIFCWQRGGVKSDTPVSDLFSRNDVKISNKEQPIPTTDSGRYYLEITLNHPRSYKFKRLAYTSQKKIYSDWMDSLPNRFEYVKKVEYYFENCEDGLPHLHGVLCLDCRYKFSAQGLVLDIVRDWVSRLPARSLLTLNKYGYDLNIDRFRCPSICVNFKYYYAIAWEKYIKKNL